MEKRVWLSSNCAKALLELSEGESVETSLDLQRSRCTVRRLQDRLISGAVELPLAGLERVIKKDQRVFQLVGATYEPLEIFSKRYATLRPSQAGPPALELDGIQMHLRHSADPWESTLAMARAVKPAGQQALDTCGGLGYVATHMCQLGARSVLSVEVCPEVLVLRRRNPWSEGLSHPAIETRIGDIRKVIRDLLDNMFGAIVHDPPRMGRRTGDLYGRPFYQELYRVMAPGGLLLHYLGRPGMQKGVAGTSRVPKRLQQVGFGELKHRRNIFCCLVRKPQL